MKPELTITRPFPMCGWTGLRERIAEAISLEYENQESDRTHDVSPESLADAVLAVIGEVPPAEGVTIPRELAERAEAFLLRDAEIFRQQCHYHRVNPRNDTADAIRSIINGGSR